MRNHLLLLAISVFLIACKPASEPFAQAETPPAEQIPLNNVTTSMEQPMPENVPMK